MSVYEVYERSNNMTNILLQQPQFIALWVRPPHHLRATSLIPPSQCNAERTGYAAFQRLWTQIPRCLYIKYISVKF